MGKNKLLYFDDEPYLNDALTKSLQLFDWDVTMVSEVDELFKELKSRQFNILILDLMAPVPNKENKYVSFTHEEIDEMRNLKGTNVGVIMTKKIRNELRISIPILFLSAKKNPIPEDPELEDINCDFLRKPQLAKTVNEKLRELLNQYKQDDHER